MSFFLVAFRSSRRPLFDADPDQDLHVLLGAPGGDGETAFRLIRQAQSRCREFTVIVPDQAKSAGSLQRRDHREHQEMEPGFVDGSDSPEQVGHGAG